MSMFLLIGEVTKLISSVLHPAFTFTVIKVNYQWYLCANRFALIATWLLKTIEMTKNSCFDVVPVCTLSCSVCIVNHMCKAYVCKYMRPVRTRFANWMFMLYGFSYLLHNCATCRASHIKYHWDIDLFYSFATKHFSLRLISTMCFVTQSFRCRCMSKICKLSCPYQLKHSTSISNLSSI